MIIDALKQIKTALIFLLLFSLLTGIIYPALVTVLAQIFFPYQQMAVCYSTMANRLALHLLDNTLMHLIIFGEGLRPLPHFPIMQ